MDEIFWQQHDNGVHVNCSEKDCQRAGTVEQYHSHDYDGPIVCCKDDE